MFSFSLPPHVTGVYAATSWSLRKRLHTTAHLTYTNVYFYLGLHLNTQMSHFPWVIYCTFSFGLFSFTVKHKFNLWNNTSCNSQKAHWHTSTRQNKNIYGWLNNNIMYRLSFRAHKTVETELTHTVFGSIAVWMLGLGLLCFRELDPGRLGFCWLLDSHFQRYDHMIVKNSSKAQRQWSYCEWTQSATMVMAWLLNSNNYASFLLVCFACLFVFSLYLLWIIPSNLC